MATSSRRDFLSVSLLGVGAASLGLLALSKHASGKVNSAISEALGPLRPVRDENTGLPLLRLPEGYRYRLHIIQWLERFSPIILLDCLSVSPSSPWRQPLPPQIQSACEPAASVVSTVL